MSAVVHRLFVFRESFIAYTSAKLADTPEASFGMTQLSPLTEYGCIQLHESCFFFGSVGSAHVLFPLTIIAAALRLFP
jgi:hypothetical protein